MTYLWLRDLQVSHLDTARGEIWDLKFDLNGSLGALAGTDATHASTKATSHTASVLIVTTDTGQTKLGAHQELLAATKLLDLPHNGALLRRVVHTSYVCPKARRIGILGDRNNDLDVVCRASPLELSPGLEHVLYPGARMALHHAFYPDQRLDLCVQAVAHELELAVRGNKGDRPVVLETGQSYALVKLDVFHLNSLASRGPTSRFKHDLVVQSQAQLRHAGQVALHLDSAEDLGSQDIAVGGNHEVQALDDVQEDLILSVPDALGPP